MLTDEKIEAVLLDNAPHAVRITFTYNGKYYARQYAINSQLTTEQAIDECIAYRDRVLLRAGIGRKTINKMYAPNETEAALVKMPLPSKRVREPNWKARQAASRDVLYVLAHYAVTSEHEGAYINVYGNVVTKQAPY